MYYSSRNIFCEDYINSDIYDPESDLQLKFNTLDSDNHNLDINFDVFTKAVINKDSMAFDLLRIAIYVYIADSLTPRGTNKDALDEEWKTDLNFYIPVLNPDFWNKQEIKELLKKTLDFAVGHSYTFEFSQWNENKAQLFLDLFKDNNVNHGFDCISLFSGGVDSLYSAIKLLEDKKKPLLISHRSTPKLQGKRKTLVEELNKTYQPKLSHWEIKINRKKDPVQDRNQRSRSFLYACIGIAFAKCLNLTDVYLSDNGIVSFNLPFTGQNIGTKNTRSTNPKLIYYINQLALMLWDNEVPQVENLLLWHTKADVIKGLQKYNKAKLLSDTVSCVDTYNFTDEEKFCGICSQCIDRRFAVEHSNISDDEDPRYRYKKNIFTDELKAGHGKTHAENYYRNAEIILKSTDDEFFACYQGKLLEYHPDNEDEQEFFENALKLHKKHSKEVYDTVNNFGSELRLGNLPENCLVSFAFRENNIKKEKETLKPIEKPIWWAKLKTQNLVFYGLEIELTPVEFYIINALTENVGETTLFDRLIMNEDSNNETIKVHIGKISKKIEKLFKEKKKKPEKEFKNIVNSIRGKGYKLLLKPSETKIK